MQIKERIGGRKGSLSIRLVTILAIMAGAFGLSGCGLAVYATSNKPAEFSTYPDFADHKNCSLGKDRQLRLDYDDWRRQKSLSTRELNYVLPDLIRQGQKISCTSKLAGTFGGKDAVVEISLNGDGKFYRYDYTLILDPQKGATKSLTLSTLRKGITQKCYSHRYHNGELSFGCMGAPSLYHKELMTIDKKYDFRGQSMEDFPGQNFIEGLFLFDKLAQSIKQKSFVVQTVSKNQSHWWLTPEELNSFQGIVYVWEDVGFWRGCDRDALLFRLSGMNKWDHSPLEINKMGYIAFDTQTLIPLYIHVNTAIFQTHLKPEGGLHCQVD